MKGGQTSGEWLSFIASSWFNAAQDIQEQA